MQIKRPWIRTAFVAISVVVAAGLATDRVVAGDGDDDGDSWLSASCGDTLMADTRLDSDLECSGTALTIGADSITLDLNGHSLTSLDGMGTGVDITGGHDGVTIENGAIGGFQEAIRTEEASDLTLKDLTILGVSGRGTRPGEFGVAGAIFIAGGERVEIRDSRISGVPNFVPGGPGPDAILLHSVADVTIRHVDIDGGFVGVDLASCGEPWLDPDCPPLDEQAPTTGTVKNCTIANNVVGVILINSVDVTTEENVISGAQQGIRIGLLDLVPVSHLRIRENEVFGNAFGVVGFLQPTMGGAPGPIFDVEFEENYIHNNFLEGVRLFALRDSRLSENMIVDNDRFGFRLRVGSTGNVISENTCVGNGIDIFHDDSSSPNTWKENCFEISQGADSGEPECDGSGAAIVAPDASGTTLRRGDCNDDGNVDISDAVCILGWLFLGEAEPGCVAVTNTNGDAAADLSDAVYLLGHLFLGGPAPVAPYPDCGPGLLPADEALRCDIPPEGCQ